MAKQPQPASQSPTTSAFAGEVPRSPMSSDKTITAPPDNCSTTTTAMPTPGVGRALFSTALGTQPPRSLPDPPPPVIVRGSNKVEAVVASANYWQRKYRHQCMSIFPNCNWVIEDFWDAVDIHFDTAEHLKEVLKFILSDNVYCARKCAKEFSEVHPEALKVIRASDLTGVYDASNPLAIVDKIFVYGETQRFPRQFLWHVAHIIRTTMSSMRHAAVGGDNPPAPKSPAPVAASEIAVAKSRAPAPKVDGPLVVDGTSAAPKAAAEKASSKKNRKQTRRRPQRLTVPTTEPSSTAIEPGRAPLVPRSRPSPVVPPVAPHIQSHDPHQSAAYHGHKMGPIAGGSTGYYAMSPSYAQSQNPTIGQRNKSSGQYERRKASGAGTENMPHGSSGTYYNSPLGPHSVVHSPYANPASVVMAQQHPGHSYAVPPFAFGPPMMAPSMPPGQPYYPGQMPPQPVYMAQQAMPHGYAQQPYGNRRSRGNSFVDMSNSQHYKNSVHPQNVAPRYQGNRRTSLSDNAYGSSSNSHVLYDDKAGTKAARNGYTDGLARSRKSSVPEQRSRQASDGIAPSLYQPGPSHPGFNRSDNAAASGNRFSSYGYPKTRPVDDPAITGDRIAGCGPSWIGPENTTVLELFIGDVPDEVETTDLESLFSRLMDMKPTRVSVGKTVPRHAFVEFATVSDARDALKICNHNPKVRGRAVKVSVPKRYFSKDDGTHYHPRRLDSKAADGRDTSSVLPAHPQGVDALAPVLETQVKDSIYSDQDVRSSLHKTTSHESNLRNSASNGSPHAHKGQTPGTSPLKISDKKRADSITEEPTEKDVARRVKAPSSGYPEKATTPSPGGPTLTTEQRTSENAEPSDATPLTESTQTDISASTVTPAMPDNDDATVEKPLEPRPQLEETPGSGHRRVESQTKEDLAVDTVEPPNLVVNIPVSPTRSASPEPHVSAKDKNAEPTESAKTEGTLQSHEEALSDKDQELSFQSAPEVAEVESTLVPPAEPIPANQGSENLSATLPEDSVTLDSSLSEAAEPIQISPKTPIPDSTAIEQEVAPPVAGPLTTTASAPEDAQDSIRSEKGILKLDVSPTMASVPPAKRSGPQQTPSVNPFAVQKALERKRREEEKKEKKRKALEEQVAKAKAKGGKGTSSAASKKPAASLSGDQEPQASSATTSRSDVESQTNVLASQQSASQTAKGKGKGKRHVASPVEAIGELASSASKTHVVVDLTKEDPPSEDEVTEQDVVAAPTSHQDPKIEGQAGVSGKQTGGSATKTPNQTGSVTEKAKVCKTAIAARRKDSTIDSAPTSLAQSPEHDGKREAADNVPSSTAVVLSSPKKTDDVTVPKKNKKPVPAVPDLDLQSLGKTNNTIGSAAAPKASSATEDSAQVLTQSAPELDAVSCTSHDTTLNETAALTSPSPTAEDFHTPLQTPAATGPEPQAPAAKKKKRKNNKKKAAAATQPAESKVVGEASSSAPPTNTAGDDDEESQIKSMLRGFHSTGPSKKENPLYYNADPFRHQIRHVDAILHEASNPSPSNYYADVDRRRAERKVAEEKAIAEGKPVPGQAEKNYWARMKAFADEFDEKPAE